MAYNVNEFGQVVGQAETSTTGPNHEDFCGYGTGLTCVAFLCQDGVMRPLPLLGGNNGVTTGNVNNLGQVPGAAENSTLDSACAAPQVPDFEPVIWGPKRGEIQMLSPRSRAADDFAYFSQVVPGFFFILGTQKPGTTSGINHAPNFQADDSAIPVGMRAMTEVLLEYLRTKPSSAVHSPRLQIFLNPHALNQIHHLRLIPPTPS